MPNCLITKLKAAVDNDELLKIGELRIGFGQADGDLQTSVNVTETQDLKVIAGTGVVTGAYGVTVSGDIIHVPASTPGGAYGGTFYSSANDAVVSIPNKYILSRLFLNKYCWGDLDIDALKYSDSMTTFFVSDSAANLKVTGDISSLKQCRTQLQIVNKDVYGDISAFANYSYRRIRLDGCSGIYGDISALSSAVGLTYFNLLGSGVSGTYESLIEGQCTAGRTSGTMQMLSSNCTLNGSSAGLNVMHFADFSSDGASIRKYGSSTPIATYVKSSGTWTYA